MKKILSIVIVMWICVGCHTQRDLYDTASPLLSVQGNWIPSLGVADMSGRATAVFYKNNDVVKEFFYHPNSVTTRVSRGAYDILLFNGLFFSEENPNLDQLFFRNTHSAATFEAVVEEAVPNGRLVRAQGEYLASNNMEVLTSAYMQLFVEGENQYYLKYKDGRNGYPVLEDYVEHEVRLTPVALSYAAQIVIHLVNPSSAAVANGSLRGFAGSVFMASGMPSHFDVTHQLRLNNLTINTRGTKGDAADPETGTIESPWFVTFGPPLDLPDRRYTFEVNIILKNGEVFSQVCDVTHQVEQSIKMIQNHRKIPIETHIALTIPIELFLELPEVELDSSVGVNDWSDDEIIIIKI